MGNKINSNNFNNTIKALKECKTFKAICCLIIILLLGIFIHNIVINALIEKTIAYTVSNEVVTMEITTNNEALISDNYRVNFNGPVSNFEIRIPFKSNYGYITKISDIKVNGYKPKIIKNNDYVSINIKIEAQANEIVNGNYTRDISLSYKVDRGDDNDLEFDHLDYYITSPLRSFKLSSLDFKVILPRNTKSSIDNIYYLFSKENPSGMTNVTKNDSKISLSADGTSITGKITSGLNAYEGLLLNHDVYQDYFDKTRNEVSNGNKLIALYVIFFFVCFINYFLCGKDSTMIYNSQESIPKEISPLVTSLLIAKNEEEKEKINEFEFNHLSSLIIKWANLGFLNIERYKAPLSVNDQFNDNEKELKALENINNLSQVDDKEKKKLFENNRNKVNAKQDFVYEFRFTKLKEVMRSEIPYFEKSIFDSLFVMSVNGNVDTNTIKANLGPFRECLLYLKNQLIEAKSEVLNYVERINSVKEDKLAKNKKFDLKVLSFICWSIALFFNTALTYKNLNNYINPLVFLLLLAIYYFVILQDNNKVNVISTIIFIIISYYMLNMNPIGFILLSMQHIMIITIRKYTFQYELAIEKIKGFKKFIKKSNRVNIVNTLNENPKYFYEALPQAIALELNEKLIKRCEEFKIAMPGWLIMQPNEFNIAIFNDLIKQIDSIWNELINNTF